MGKQGLASAACGLLLLLATTASAHHSVWAEFDNDTPLELRGHFIKMDWLNPHSAGAAATCSPATRS
jgi:hypothetical protein